MSAAEFPDGIAEPHLSETSARAGPMGWLILFALGALMIAAMLGLFGGGASPTLRASAPEATLTVHAPRVLRNGEFFEMRIRVEARQVIAEPTLLIPTSYWHDLTINTLEPSPAHEGYEGEAMAFAFDRLSPGDTLAFKIDGQINPALFAGTRGTLVLRDGRRPLASLPLELRVLP